MNPRRLFVASCIALVASAFSFVTRGDILPALGSTFDLNQTSRGLIAGTAFLGHGDLDVHRCPDLRCVGDETNARAGVHLSPRWQCAHHRLTVHRTAPERSLAVHTCSGRQCSWSGLRMDS